MLLKYALFAFCFVGGIAIASNYNSIANVYTPIHYGNETLLVFKLWSGPQLLIYVGVCLLAFFITVDLVVRDTGQHGKFIDKITKQESTYFCRLSNLDRKKWICEEHYRRQNLGIRLLSDEQLDKLIRTPGKRFKLSNDPINYDILSSEQQ